MCLLLLSVGTFSQSKLMGAGKATKVGASAGASHKTAKTTTPVKRNNTAKGNVAKGKQTSQTQGDLFKITDIDFANADGVGTIIDDYGSKLYAGELRYLKSRIVYNGQTSSAHEIDLCYKIYKEDGTLEKGKKSPDGYTWKSSVDIEPGRGNTVEMPGWGSSTGQSYEPGVYTYEIWCKDKCQISKKVRIYTGAKPVSTSSLLSISSVKLTNVDREGNVLSTELYAGEVKYIPQMVSYRGLNATAQNAKIYSRIFNAEGKLVRLPDAPTGFSRVTSVTVKPGYNTFRIEGIGRKNTTDLYTEGEHKIEYWLDGEKIYEMKFNVVKRGGAGQALSGSPTGSSDLIKNLVVNPCDISSCNIFTSSRSVFLEKLKSKYAIKENEDYPGHYYAIQDDNSYMFNKLSYCGIPMHRLDCILRDNSSRVVYSWEPKTSEYPDKYALLNTLVADLNKIGIPISYERTNDKYEIAKGGVKFAGKSYTISITDYHVLYQIELVIDNI